MMQGLELMVAGMVMVFIFLTIMIISVNGAAAIIRRFEKDTPPSGGGSSSSNKDNLAEVAIAVAAVKAHTRS